MNRVAIFQRARLASQRVPRKLLAKVGGRTLLDRGLRWMRRVAETTGAVPVVACPPGDTEIVEAVQAMRMTLIPLDDHATRSECWSDHYGPLVEPLSEICDWIWDANILCRPFLSTRIGVTAARYAAFATIPAVLTTRKRGIVWDSGDNTVIGSGQMANTKTNPVYQELSHLGYLLPVSMLAQPEATTAAACHPLSIPMGWMDRIDVDDMEDLQMAQFVGDLA